LCISSPLHIGIILVFSAGFMLPTELSESFSDLKMAGQEGMITDFRHPHALFDRESSNHVKSAPNISKAIAISTQNEHAINTSGELFEVTQDSGLNCGSKYWGIKDFQNRYQADRYNFSEHGGLPEDSCDRSSLNEVGNETYVKLISENNSGDGYKIAFQAAIQGTTPWGFNSKNDGGALNYNDRFPLPADLDYQLEAEYMWLDDEISRPSEEGNVKANLNVDLWFADTKSPRTEDGHYKNIMIIDFSFASLENRDGHWRIRDSVVEGKPYFNPYTRINDNNGQTTYTYNTVLDTDGEQPGQWYAPSPTTYKKTIKQFIDDAFNYEYKTEGGEKVDKPIRSDYKLIDIEAGIEVWAADDDSSGTIVILYSTVRLAYRT
jgi:hypothetical protein